VTFIYLLSKNYKSHLKVLIILCFYSGLAAFSGKNFENIYKILVVVISIILLIKNNGMSGLNRKEQFFLFSFILFSVSFLYSAFINKDYFNLTFSQYGKYVTPVCIFLLFKNVLKKDSGNLFTLKNLFLTILTIQIALTVVKIFTIGMQESTVGSIAFIGGGPAAVLPVLGFILVWFDRQGNLKSRDWIYILLLILIGAVSFKRAILFVMPFFIFMFTYYVPRKLKSSYLLYAIPLLPLLFYVGVRLNPTLNREEKMWGSFDLGYVLDYTQNYTFGKTSDSPEVKLGQGRGGATLLLVERFFNDESLTYKDIWGIGLKEVYTTNYEEFENVGYGVNSKGSITGVYQSYLTAGFTGVAVTILLLFSISTLIKEPRIRLTLTLLMLWDYLFYSGLILRTQGLLILFFYIIVYSNYQFDKRTKPNYASVTLERGERDFQQLFI